MNVFKSDLRRKMQERMLKGKECMRQFLPEHELHAIFTEDVVNQLLRESLSTDNFDHDCRTIYEEGIKVLAILLNNRCELLINMFFERDMLDSRLPFQESTFKDRKLDDPNDLGINFAKVWQWPFIPAEFNFDRRLRLWKYQQDIIVPIVNLEAIGRGAYGNVDCITIPARYEDLFAQNPRFATQDQYHAQQLAASAEQQGRGSKVIVVRKQLLSRTSEAEDLYKEEVRCLRLLNQKKHPNIIELLYCYIHNETRNFIFPYFKMDLRALLKEETRFADFTDATFFSALSDLASALQCVHNLKMTAKSDGIELEYVGYHHDFRPANILISRDTFILADFGLAKIKPAEEGSRTQSKQGDLTYLAPECRDADYGMREVGRAVDIWAFGCISLEVATYIRGGADATRRFGETRKPPPDRMGVVVDSFHENGSDKPQVIDHISQLRNSSPSCHIKQLLDLSQKMLNIDSTQRPDIRHVHRCTLSLAIQMETLQIQNALGEIQDQHWNSKPSEPQQHEFWLEKERFCAWVKAIDAHETENSEEKFHGDKDLKSTILMELRRGDRRIRGFEDFKADAADIEHNAFVDLQTPVAALRSLNDNLWAILPMKQKTDALWLWQQSVLSLTNIGRVVALEDRQKLPLDPQDPPFLSENLLKAAKMKENKNERKDQQNPDIFLNEKDISIDKPGQRISRGNLRHNNEAVLIERKPFSSGWDKLSKQERDVRIQLLATNLDFRYMPEDLHILGCKGLVVSKDDYKFVYKLPRSDSQLTQIKSLRDLFRESKSKPALEQKMQLAHALASGLAKLHLVGWVHRNLTSENIIFIINDESDKHWAQPYMVGLSSARPSSTSFQSEGFLDDPNLLHYYNPEYDDEIRFQPSYDYYSLGVLLMEIGSWKFQSKKGKIKRQGVHDGFMKEEVNGLRSRMGSAYQKVVRACMDGSLSGEGNVWDGSEVSEAWQLFRKEVVVVLDSLSRCPL